MSGAPGTLADFFHLDDAALRGRTDALRSSQQLVKAKQLHGPGVRGAVADSLAQRAKEILDAPVTGILGEAWSKYSDLREFRDTSKYPPGKISEYALADHEIALKRNPKVDLLLNGVSCGLEIEFELKLALKLETAKVLIDGGRIVGAKVGTVKGQGVFSCAKIVLAERQGGGFPLPGQVSFNPGYEIR